MPLSSKVLEDSIRLDRIRRIKWTLYVVQIIMLAALAALMIFIMGNAQITPVLYLPLDSFAAVMVLLLLVVCVESFFFRVMEIRFARSSSAKHLMAKNSIRVAITIAVVSGFVALLLMAPPVLSAVQDATSRTLILSADEPITFWSRDPLAFQEMVEVRVTAVNTVEVYLVDGDLYDEDNWSLSEMFILRINKGAAEYVVDGEVVIDVPEADHNEYALILNDLENPGSVATVTILRDISGTLTGIVSLLAIAIVVSNIAWVAYLMPIERKYSKGSIYK
ncbi:MAG: hypothetical protein JSV94_04895 [Methanobacteriota archaeon]|nr:MAG: hypothetical protein JSV94_04895 [Euryarchaeota archaeon]